MHSTYLVLLKRPFGSLKVRVEQNGLEMSDQGPRVTRRRVPLGGCFIDLPSHGPLSRTQENTISMNRKWFRLQAIYKRRSYHIQRHISLETKFQITYTSNINFAWNHHLWVGKGMRNLIGLMWTRSFTWIACHLAHWNQLNNSMNSGLGRLKFY